MRVILTTLVLLFATSVITGNDLRTLSGKHIKITTDVTGDTASEEVALLPAVFDTAVTRWCDWFGVTPAAVATWQVNAVLIGDERRFANTTLLRDMPPLRHGFAWQNRLWIRNQASHTANTTLILHEGVHLFVEHYKLGTSPAWYHEGIADWLTLSPQNAAAGRIATLQREVTAGRVKSIGEVQRFTRNNFETDDSLPYAWSWALCSFLAEHPQHSVFFRSLATIPEEQRNTRLNALIAAKRFVTVREWVAWLCDLDAGEILQSGHLPKSGIDETQRERRNDFEIAASAGWHATGFIVEAGKPITLTATGQVPVHALFRHSREGGNLDNTPQADAQANPTALALAPRRVRGGDEVNHEQFPGQYLLEAVVVSDEPNQSLAAIAKIFSSPVAVGTHTTWTPPTRGRLLIRISGITGSCRVTAKQ